MDWKKFWDNQARASDDNQQVGRISSQQKIDDSTLNRIAEHIHGHLAITKEDKVLDVCCGNGLLTQRLALKCKHITGVDLSSVLIEKASQKKTADNMEFIVADATNLSQLNTTFDKIYLYFSFQYFDSFEKGKIVVANMASLLNPGGKIFIGDTPNRAKKGEYYNSLRKRLKLVKDTWLGKNDMGKFWSKAEMNTICKSLNLEGLWVEEPEEMLYAHYRFDYLITKR